MHKRCGKCKKKQPIQTRICKTTCKFYHRNIVTSTSWSTDAKADMMYRIVNCLVDNRDANEHPAPASNSTGSHDIRYSQPHNIVQASNHSFIQIHITGTDYLNFLALTPILKWLRRDLKQVETLRIVFAYCFSRFYHAHRICLDFLHKRFDTQMQLYQSWNILNS